MCRRLSHPPCWSRRSRLRHARPRPTLQRARRTTPSPSTTTTSPSPRLRSPRFRRRVAEGNGSRRPARAHDAQRAGRGSRCGHGARPARGAGQGSRAGLRGRRAREPARDERARVAVLPFAAARADGGPRAPAGSLRPEPDPERAAARLGHAAQRSRPAAVGNATARRALRMRSRRATTRGSRFRRS